MKAQHFHHTARWRVHYLFVHGAGGVDHKVVGFGAKYSSGKPHLRASVKEIHEFPIGMGMCGKLPPGRYRFPIGPAKLSISCIECHCRNPNPVKCKRFKNYISDGSSMSTRNNVTFLLRTGPHPCCDLGEAGFSLAALYSKTPNRHSEYPYPVPRDVPYIRTYLAWVVGNLISSVAPLPESVEYTSAQFAPSVDSWIL